MPYPTKTLYRFLDTTGDGTGSKAMNIDGSTVPGKFKITVPDGQRYIIHRIFIHYEDTGTFDTDTYGTLVALTNGIEIEVYDSNDTLILDLNDGLPVKKNSDWSRNCYDIDVQDFGSGASKSTISARWTFAKDSLTGMMLEAGDYFQFTINDNLTLLTEHHVAVRGFKRLV